MLFAVVVQLAVLVSARSTAQAAVDSLARREAVATVGAGEFVAELSRVLPGARDVEVTVDRSGPVVSAVLEFQWDPPGPRFVPVMVRVEGRAPIVAPP